MKIAIVSDDGATVSPHFGQAKLYVVLTVRNGKITAEERRPKIDRSSHEKISEPSSHDFEADAQPPHKQIAWPFVDCGALIVGGMAQATRDALVQLGIEVIVTDVENAHQAALLYACGDLPNVLDRLR